MQPDPFAITADPEAYVPRAATECALARMLRALRAGAPSVVISGESGAGKTLLLHVLARRLDGAFQCIYVPYPRLAPREFFQWALAALNEPARGDDPARLLGDRIRRDAAVGFPPLLWLLDDAGSMPAETRAAVLEVQDGLGGALRTVWALPGEAGESPPLLGDGAVHVVLEGRMGVSDTARYLRARLDHCAADTECRSRLELALGELHVGSNGNPGRLHLLASQLLARRV